LNTEIAKVAVCVCVVLGVFVVGEVGKSEASDGVWAGEVEVIGEREDVVEISAAALEVVVLALQSSVKEVAPEVCDGRIEALEHTPALMDGFDGLRWIGGECLEVCEHQASHEPEHVAS